MTEQQIKDALLQAYIQKEQAENQIVGLKNALAGLQAAQQAAQKAAAEAPKAE